MRAERIIAITEIERRRLIHKGISAERIVVIPDGVTLSHPNTVEPPYEYITILSIGRLDVLNKGQDILLQAISLIKDKHSNIKLVII
ncbi:unnamed protein product, partial [marine sediment metagenome]